MPLFSKKQPAQPQSRRNPAAEHNARLRGQPAQQNPPDQKPVAPPESQPRVASTPATAQTGPGQRLRDLTRTTASAPLPPPPSAQPDAPARSQRKTPPGDNRFDWNLRLPKGKKILQGLKKIHSALAVIVDIGLVLVVLVLLTSLKSISNTVNSVISQLYKSFVTMDNATISTNIHVDDAVIPLDFTLPVVQSETYVILTQDVTIRNATVGILSLPTTVTLPAGTALPVSLSMEVPVQTTLLVDLEVPVNIKLAEANPPAGQDSLHGAFLNLQSALGPYYCIFQQQLRDTSDPACEGRTYVGIKQP